ncbi:hypothetical protein T310_9750 [Rasamsonia emersonii CBS 393.64]|uniref:Uncharacterized protein n=1 Tax=Rasamsonia emersonii (strain ATCC 16479 / CBS 393.64 / IMI 116815) TaxID=1408163 RepID=A0A0F4YEN3_RASE3|nr:hypothetical protein T310_9750 [Rasamsonia emersonii CBS 393.64]KKA16632.1 hypothetical protein T310_9750 [Rasamsonia emersonii CBS 393.64]
MLHPSVPDQRCACQGFRLDESLPGAHCECGHQACYHSHSAAVPPPAEESPVSSSVAYAALLDRINSLEAQYQRDRKIWQEELQEERRARREDVRVLREAMHAFFQFMEQDVPRQFVDIEDKIESVVDRQQQLHERVMTVDDSSMVLEDRIAELERAVARETRDQAEWDNDEDDVDHDEAGRRSPVGAQRADKDLGSFGHSVKTQVSGSDTNPSSPSRSSATHSSDPTIHGDDVITKDDESIKQCQDLPSLSQNSISPAAARTQRNPIPERQLLIQAIRDCDCESSPPSESEIGGKPSRSPSPFSSRYRKSSGSPPSSCTTVASNSARVLVPAKRKRQQQHAWTLPNPPPLSLSDSSVEYGRCCKCPRPE